VLGQDDSGVENTFSVAAEFSIRNYIDLAKFRRFVSRKAAKTQREEEKKGRQKDTKKLFSLPLFPLPLFASSRLCARYFFPNVTSMTVLFESDTILSSALERKNR
jgi:hypothetical protein